MRMRSTCATAGWTYASGSARNRRRAKRPPSRACPVFDTAEAAKRADVIMVLVPDEMGAEIYEAEIAPHLTKGKYLAFGHGFNIHFKFIKPPADVNVFMIAPKGPGHLVRSEYTKGRGVPCLLAVQQDPSGDTTKVGLAYGSAIGGGRAAIIETIVQGRNRNRSVRRAVRAVRRTDRTDSRRLRDAGRSRLRARDGVLRMPARSEADRGPDLRGRNLEHALLDQQHRRVRRHDARQRR